MSLPRRDQRPEVRGSDGADPCGNRGRWPTIVPVRRPVRLWLVDLFLAKRAGLSATIPALGQAGISGRGMSKLVSFVVLVAVILVIGAIFALVMAQFILPLFLAMLLVVLFRPLYQWFCKKCRGRAHVAAGLTTTTVMVIVLVPLLWVMITAAAQGWALARQFDQESLRETMQAKAGHLVDQVRRLGENLGMPVPSNQEIVQTIVGDVQGWIAPAALRTTQFLGGFIGGLLIMLIAFYFFLVDGAAMTGAVMRLTPLDKNYQQQMLDEFVNVSRAVVLATLLAAITQGLLAGLGYFVAGLGSVALLTMMTMLLSLVPFVGAASVWGSCALWLYFWEERPLAALLLAAWGLLVVSTIDNFIKPLVLKGQSNLHPLLAFLSVLGGMDALGPIGIFVGPMVVSFLQALLNILRVELESMEKKPAAPNLSANP